MPQMRACFLREHRGIQKFRPKERGVHFQGTAGVPGFQNRLFVLREYYCPGCATLFDVDMVARDKKVIRSARFD